MLSEEGSDLFKTGLRRGELPAHPVTRRSAIPAQRCGALLAIVREMKTWDFISKGSLLHLPDFVAPPLHSDEIVLSLVTQQIPEPDKAVVRELDPVLS